MQFFWDNIFSFFNIVSDNVYFVLLLLSGITAIVMFTMQIIISKTTKYKPRIIFGPISMLILYFVGDVTTNLPVLHPRMNLALSTTAGIIQQSNTYLTNFESVSGLKVKSSRTIAEFLYNLSSTEKALWKCEPQTLYQSLFETMDQIRGGLFLPDADMPCFGSLNTIFVIAIIVSLTLLLSLALFSKVKPKEVIWGFISFAFVMFMCIISSGAAFASLCAWSISTFLFFLSDCAHKKEPGSFSAK